MDTIGDFLTIEKNTKIVFFHFRRKIIIIDASVLTTLISFPGINSVMSTQTRPYPGSLLSLTSKGEICIFDPTASERSGLDATEKRTQNDCVFTQSINVCARPLPIVHSLENGFSVDSSLFIQVKLDEDAARLGLNLASGRYNVNNHFHRNLISGF